MRFFAPSVALGLLLAACSGDKAATETTESGTTSGSSTTEDTNVEVPVDPYWVDDDGDGFSEGRGDCDDNNAAIFPRATELCNGIDDDCDTKVDDDDVDVVGQALWWEDSDLDGFGNELYTTLACVQPDGFADNPQDCDDTDAAVNPATVWYIDTDFDGHGSNTATRTSCEKPGGYAMVADDCDDSDGTVFPGAEEVCNEKDDDCDSLVDDDDGIDCGLLGP